MHSIDVVSWTDVTHSVVCVSVCWSHWFTVQKRLNRTRCRLGDDSRGPKEPCVTWESRSSTERSNYLGLSGCHWKTLGVSAVVYAARGVIIQRHWLHATKGIIQSSITADTWCGLSSKFFDHLLWHVNDERRRTDWMGVLLLLALQACGRRSAAFCVTSRRRTWNFDPSEWRRTDVEAARTGSQWLAERRAGGYQGHHGRYEILHN